MSLCQIVVNCYGPQRGLLRFGQNFARRKVDIRQSEISIRHSAVSQCVIGVDRDCFFESLYRLQHPLFVVLVPEIAASEIEVISFSVLCWLFIESYPILAGDL